MPFINIGFGNVVNSDKVCSIVSPEAAPIKRMIQSAKDSGIAVDCTCGRKTKAVLVMENRTIVLSSLHPETIATRMNTEDERRTS
ncbi:MAG: DUF370 domain-containing protein [Eubacterium sp.]|nr:DUF370 domain-containing protein [Eubacterium sp.]